jgi:GntR family transcriptional regulator
VARQPELPYERIVRELTARIRSGELRPGEQIPTVSALCRDYKVSKVTALKAVERLRDDGLVTTVPRWGSFVAED